jgi:hypothetical protein
LDGQDSIIILKLDRCAFIHVGVQSLSWPVVLW